MSVSSESVTPAPEVASASSMACCPGVAAGCERAALLFSAAALAGSLFLSLGMQLQACPLCIYERTFLMGVVSVLLLCWLLRDLRQPGAGALLALPLAVAGTGVAKFHVWLEMNGTLVCPYGVAGLGTAPQQSLAAYTVIVVLLLVAVAGSGQRGLARRLFGAALPGLLIGALLGAAAVLSGPSLPAATKTLAELQADQATPALKGCQPVKAQ